LILGIFLTENPQPPTENGLPVAFIHFLFSIQYGVKIPSQPLPLVNLHLPKKTKSPALMTGLGKTFPRA
jgi:hypothetical protein